MAAETSIPPLTAVPPPVGAIESAISGQPHSVSDVMIILDARAEGQMDQVVANLKQLGLNIATIDTGEGMIEGTINAFQVGHLQQLPNVDYVRTIFTYTAHVPPGDGQLAH